MRRLSSLLSVSFAVSAALIAMAARPNSKTRGSLRADHCNGGPKICSQTVTCTKWCGQTCCEYNTTYEYYNEKT